MTSWTHNIWVKKIDSNEFHNDYFTNDERFGKQQYAL